MSEGTLLEKQQSLIAAKSAAVSATVPQIMSDIWLLAADDSGNDSSNHPLRLPVIPVPWEESEDGERGATRINETPICLGSNGQAAPNETQ